MSDEKALALRMADVLEKRRLTRWVHSTGETPRASGYVVDEDCAQAAAELRRLHEVNAELLEALEDAAEAFEILANDGGVDTYWYARFTSDAVAKAKEKK